VGANEEAYDPDDVQAFQGADCASNEEAYEAGAHQAPDDVQAIQGPDRVSHSKAYDAGAHRADDRADDRGADYGRAVHSADYGQAVHGADVNGADVNADRGAERPANLGI
jgi:hypothetical protein